MTSKHHKNLPYRRCVGALVFNAKGQVFVGKRSDTEEDTHAWQMPQGGIDKKEEPLNAALRELEEETAIRSVELIAESPDWLSYDLPVSSLGRWAGRYRGQTQKWFAFRFVGDESEINLSIHIPPEFSQWKWVDLQDLADLVVPFKRSVYETIIDLFSPYAE